MSISKASSSAVAPGAKGDLVVGTTTNDSGILAVGANNTVLTADSSTATGLKWAAAGGGTLDIEQIVASTNLPAASSLTISNLSGYDQLHLRIDNLSFNSNSQMGIRVNANSGSNYIWNGIEQSGGNTYQIDEFAGSAQFLFGYAALIGSSQTNNQVFISFYNCKASGMTTIDLTGAYFNASGTLFIQQSKGIYIVSEAVSSIRLDGQGANFDNGTYQLWGG